MEHLEKIKEIINVMNVSSEGKCGLYIPDLQKKSGLENDALKVILRELYIQKYITVKEGLNGKLIFKRELVCKLNKLKKPA